MYIYSLQQEKRYVKTKYNSINNRLCLPERWKTCICIIIWLFPELSKVTFDVDWITLLI